MATPSNAVLNEQTALLQKLPNELKMAREYSLLGNYETALRYFETVIGDIGRYTRLLSDAHDRQKWSKVCFITVRTERTPWEAFIDGPCR
jgi:hypothetical protein